MNLCASVAGGGAWYEWVRGGSREKGGKANGHCEGWRLRPAPAHQPCAQSSASTPILHQPGRPASWCQLTLCDVGEDLSQGGSDAGVVGQQRQRPHRHLGGEGAHQAPPRPLVLGVAEVDSQLIRQLLADAAGQPGQQQVQLAGLASLLSGLALQGLVEGRRAQQDKRQRGWGAGA